MPTYQPKYVRLSPEQAQKVSEDAALRGLSENAWFRHLVDHSERVFNAQSDDAKTAETRS